MSFKLKITAVFAAMMVLAATGAFAKINVTFNQNTGVVTEATVQPLLDSITGKWENPENMTTAFGDATAHAMNAGSFNGYQNYKLFAVGFGVVGSMHADSPSPAAMFDAFGELAGAGDTNFGVGAGSAINVGIAGKVLKPFIGADFLSKMYFNAKFMTLSGSFGDNYSYKATTVGLGANYKLLDNLNLIVLKLRGVSVGSGFYVNKNTHEFRDFNMSINTGAFTWDPTLDFDMTATTYTVPLEVSTSAQVLWLLNLTLGAGADVTFGSSELKMYTNETTLQGTGITDESITIDGSVEGTPTAIAGKVFGGLGIGLGPVKLDVPVTVYLGNGGGFATGLSAIIVF